MIKILGILVLTILSGCANSRITYQPTLKNVNEFSEIVVYRNSMFLGSALITHLTIDGVPTAEFKGGEYVAIKVNPGEHIVTTTNPVNVNIADRKIFKASEAYYFDATYQRRVETGVLPEVDASSSLKAIEVMKKVN